MDPGNSKWGQRRRPWKNTYLITDRERLETDSVVGKLVEKKRLSNLVYVEYQSPPTYATGIFRSPEGEEALRPPRSDLRSLGKISRLGEYPRIK